MLTKFQLLFKISSNFLQLIDFVAITIALLKGNLSDFQVRDIAWKRCSLCLWGASAKSVVVPAPEPSYDMYSDVVGGTEELQAISAYEGRGCYGQDTFSCVLAHAYIQPYLYKPEYMTRTHWGIYYFIWLHQLMLTSTLIGQPHKMWQNVPLFSGALADNH